VACHSSQVTQRSREVVNHVCVMSPGCSGSVLLSRGVVPACCQGVGLGVFCLYCVELCKAYPQLILVTRIVAGDVVWRLAHAKRTGGADVS
jgi:hypothetical protein